MVASGFTALAGKSSFIGVMTVLGMCCIVMIGRHAPVHKGSFFYIVYDGAEIPGLLYGE